MKKCDTCRGTKTLSEFHKRKTKDGRSNNCKVCTVSIAQTYYQGKRKYYIGKAAQRQKEAMQFLYDLKDNKPCFDCKKVHRYFALDYDHRDPTTKIACVSEMVSNRKAMLEEIAKCDLVCASCHRYRTYKTPS